MTWGGWEFSFIVSSRYDGMALSNVTYQGVKVLERASLPVMTVYYDNNACGPYADRLGHGGSGVTWAGNRSVVNRTYTQNGARWREVGFQDLIGDYIIYHVWYLSEGGTIGAHVFSRGWQCRTDHIHYPFWRLDFDLGGGENDQILRRVGGAWSVYSNEFDAPATAATEHKWRVQDTTNGMFVDIKMVPTTWNVPSNNTVVPEETYTNNRVYGRRYKAGEAGGWSAGKTVDAPHGNGEAINGPDNVLWYRGYLPHASAEGGGLWHATGIQLDINIPDEIVPDLIVDNASVTDTTPVVGASFTIRARAWNSGLRASAATTLRYFYSDDATITADDTELATGTIPGLAGGGVSLQRTTASIPTTGTWWVGACAVTVDGETDTDNNCSDGVEVTVSAALPDLAVDGVTVSNAAPTTGASFMLNATVQNQGTGAAAATTLRYVHSDDATITADDTELTTDSVSELAAGANSTENASVSITEPGAWWVGACVDTVSGEIAADNNCSTGVAVTVSVPTLPDLVVDTASVSTSTPVSGASFTINATVRNSGTAASGSTTLRYVRSDDATITSDDTELTTDSVVGLAANGSSSKSASVSITDTGTWWVGACAATVSGETVMGNNCSAGVEITVTAPDLVVDTVSVADSSIVSGTSFTINATVGNSGDGAAGATTLRYVRSDDATITSDDTELTTDSVVGLAANGSSSKSTSVSITNPGTWWVGACIATVSGEIATGNNCSTGEQVTITAADLIVENVSVSDSSVETGDSFTINATVRNSGDAASGATTLSYYRSDDATITADDTQLETDPVAELAPGADSPENASVSIADAETWWVGACVATVSGESVTSNNCSTAVAVTVAVPAVPDLLVDTVSVADSSVVTGTSFTINATVRNSGDAASGATTLNYYRSTDNTITSDDTELTTDNISGLEPSGSSSQDASVSITDPGTWWVGACVDTVNGEVVMGNNCSAGEQVTITAPDLIVQNVTVSDSSVETDDSFTINATVRNSGDADSAATNLFYYRSTDNTITSDDTQLGMDPVAELAPGADSSENISVSIADADAWWVGACVATVNGESETGNNCSTGVAVTVSVPAVPDLLVDTVTVSDSSVETGDSFTINATVRNSGDADSVATNLLYYRSTDNTITADDTELATTNVAELAPGTDSPESASVSIADADTWWVGACVATVDDESVTGNNCSAGVVVTVSVPAVPDLLVDTVSVADSSVVTGTSFTINATVRNSGDAASAVTTLHYVRSDDATITADDTELTTDNISGLEPSGSSTQNASVSITNPGTWWVGACVDMVSDENTTDNNCSAGEQVTITAPDLTIQNVTVSDSSVETGDSFTINATVHNSGDADSGATTLSYYRSADNTITADDTQLGTDPVAGLAPGADSPENVSVSIADAEAWWVGACVETVNGESETGNNCSTGVAVTVSVPAVPDLLVDTVSVADSSVVTGTSFTINATVRNSGDAASAVTTLHYVRSDDATIDASDTELTTDNISGLEPGGSSSQNASVSITDPGTWWVGACVDTVNDEVIMGNNCSAGEQVTITAPDLIVQNVSVSDSSVEPGDSFTINATVRNSGDAASGLTTLRYYRSTDNTITADDTELTTDSVNGLAPGADSPQNASVSITNTGAWWVGACVGTVSGESVTGNNCSTGVQVAVSLPAVPDLLVDTVSVTNLTPVSGASFTINATVRNSGTAASGATTLRYVRSNDNTISATDSALTTSNVNALASSANSRENASVSITNTGTWWIGACAATVSGETARGNNCSAGVEITVTAPDLIVQNVSVADSSVETGTSFTINATVRNSGDADAGATTLRYYRSDDNTITANDRQLGNDAVDVLAPNTNSPENISVSIADTGTWWVGACVATVNGETATGNNCSTGVQVTVTAPDLVVVNVGVSASTPSPGASFTINATARNSGNVASAATTLRYYRSTNNTITANDTQLGTDPVGALAAGANSPQSISVSIANTGAWWVGACVATVSGESARGNNCSTGVQVTVTALSVPDLIVVPVSVSTSTPASGASFTINATVRNSGAADAGATTLRYYRSDDNTITTDDTQLGTDPVGALAAGANSPQSISVSIADTGTWWVGACVATVNGETATGNNCSTGVQVTVTAPDLVVENVSVADSSVGTGTPFTINATVRNSGDTASGLTTLQYYRSADSTITADDTQLGTDPVVGLAPGADSPESASVSIADAETWWIGACVATVGGEVVMDNNCSTGVQVTITAPALTVDDAGVSDTTPKVDASFTINATVRNTGDGASPATTLHYVLSDDSTITLADLELATDPVAGLAPGEISEQNAPVSITNAGEFWVGACIDPVNDETDAANCSTGVQVTVTAIPGHDVIPVLPVIIELLIEF